MNTPSTFPEAITAGNLPLARSFAAELPPEIMAPGVKNTAYRQTFALALDMGELDFALEVAPFCGEKVTKEQIRCCMKIAISEGKLEQTLLCNERLGETLCWQDIYDLKAGMERTRRPIPFVLRSVGLLSPRDPLLAEFLRIMKDNVQFHRLSLEDKLLLKVMEKVTQNSAR